MSFRDLLTISNDPTHNIKSRDDLNIGDLYKYRIAFSTFLFLLNGNSTDNLPREIESFTGDEFVSYGRPADEEISEVINDGIEIGEREYKRFLDLQPNNKACSKAEKGNSP